MMTRMLSAAIFFALICSAYSCFSKNRQQDASDSRHLNTSQSSLPTTRITTESPTVSSSSAMSKMARIASNTPIVNDSGIESNAPIVNDAGIGCIQNDDRGRSYSGTANVTKFGNRCLNWNEPRLLSSGTIFSGQSGWNHNYCRNPDGDRAPWCLIRKKVDGPHEDEFCDIPVCVDFAASIDDDDAENSQAPSPAKSDQCGTRFIHQETLDPTTNMRHARIVGGVDTEPGAWPWTAAIRKNGEHSCGATVIDRMHLLTAAHCFNVNQSDWSEYEIVVGDWDNTVDEGDEQWFRIASVVQHPNYDAETMKHDIAIITIVPQNGSSIQFTKYIQPACLPTEDEAYDNGRKCIASGWGRYATATHLSHRLQAVTLPIIARADCTATGVYDSSDISASAFCAGYMDGAGDTCQGDSGGPFVCDRDDTFYLMGVVSWGDGCANANRPGIYTKVTDYLGWIRQTINA